MLIVGGNQSAGGYNVDNSLRFNRGSSDYLNRTVTSSGNLNTVTCSFWTKRTYSFGLNQDVIHIRPSGSSYPAFSIYFKDDEKIRFYDYNGGSFIFNFITTQVFRDVSAWYHIVLAIDTTQATQANRVKLYVNGSQVTSFDTSSYPSQNASFSALNTNKVNYIGSYGNGGYYNGYISEVCFIDGQQLDPTSFGEFDEDTGIWKPIDVSGLTFGTNGFYLPFENSAALGQDDSGNGNNFTVNNLTSIDQTTDTPTNNFATGNSLVVGAPGTYSDGNLTNSNNTNNWQTLFSSIAVSSGKWYVEAKAVSGHFIFGISETTSNQLTAAGPEHFIGGFTKEIGYYSQTGNKFVENVNSSYGATYTAGDIIGMALDLDSGTRTITFYKNGASQGAITLPTTMETMTFGIANNQSGSSASFNFGNPPFTISSGNSDANGYGNFEYAVPSGYYALNTKNLAEYG